MDIEIIAIGNEVLEGFTVNSNASFLSKELIQAGHRIMRHTVLADDPEILSSGLKEALLRSPVVITTGGLGPTCDDLSKQVAASIFDSGFHYDENLGEEIVKRYGRHMPSVENQATVPDKAELMQNPAGTAPGFIFRNERSMLMMLPGVPSEMRLMLEKEVIPRLATQSGTTKQFYKALHFGEMPESAMDPLLRQIEAEYPGVKAGIYPNLGLITVHLKVMASNEREADKLLKKPFELIYEKYKSRSFNSDSGKIEEAIHHLFIQEKWTLSAAESCTGGGISARLTKIPGCSNYFQGGIVAYSNDLKVNLLNVSQETLNRYGAVSEEVAIEMVEGLLEKTGTDFGVSVTGIAGPDGGTVEKPVGTVWCAIAGKAKKTLAWKLKGYATREMIIERSINGVLANLYQYAQGRQCPITFLDFKK